MTDTKFTPIIRRRALDSRVLVVANTRIEGKWCAYIAAVPKLAAGLTSTDEAHAVISFITALISGAVGSVVAIISILTAFDNLTAIHAWVGMFRPEIYLAYKAIF